MNQPIPNQPSRITKAQSALSALTVLVFSIGFLVQPVAAEPGDTTTSLPEDNRLLGNSIQRPNMGMKPLSPTDPGGWLQVSLFFLICGAIILIACAVWYSSKKKRSKRADAGLDPVSLARATGKGVRAPSPLDKTPAASPETASSETATPETVSPETAGSENAGQDS
ncbi:MAG: hypothetical protein WCJ04_03585 [Actinomycetes bacterium]